MTADQGRDEDQDVDDEVSGDGAPGAVVSTAHEIRALRHELVRLRRVIEKSLRSRSAR